MELPTRQSNKRSGSFICTMCKASHQLCSNNFISLFFLFLSFWHINFLLLSLCNAFWKPIAYRSQVMCRYWCIFHLNFQTFQSLNLGQQCTQIKLQNLFSICLETNRNVLSASLKRMTANKARPSLHVVTKLKIANNNIAVKISSSV